MSVVHRTGTRDIDDFDELPERDDEIDVIGRVRHHRRGDSPENLFLDAEEGNVVLVASWELAEFRR